VRAHETSEGQRSAALYVLVVYRLNEMVLSPDTGHNPDVITRQNRSEIFGDGAGIRVRPEQVAGERLRTSDDGWLGPRTQTDLDLLPKPIALFVRERRPAREDLPQAVKTALVKDPMPAQASRLSEQAGLDGRRAGFVRSNVQVDGLGPGSPRIAPVDEWVEQPMREPLPEVSDKRQVQHRHRERSLLRHDVTT
jgi:hypothetical protein